MRRIWARGGLRGLGLAWKARSPQKRDFVPGCTGGVCSKRFLRDRADAGSWQIADRCTVASSAAHRIAVGDFRVCFVAEL